MTVALILDEMYPPKLVEKLHEHGHDVVAVVLEHELKAAADDEVLAAAFKSQRVLVTENIRDFATLAIQLPHYGVVMVNGRRWRRTPAGMPRIAAALNRMINSGQLPGPGEIAWLV